MPIRVQCPGCGKFSKAPDNYAGKIERCPACGVSVVIPSITAAETVANFSPPEAADEPESKAPFVEIDTRSQVTAPNPARRRRTVPFPVVVGGCICIFVGCLTTLFVLGSGPTPEERYDTALSILERERGALNAAKPDLESAMADAMHWAFHKVTGEMKLTDELIDIKLKYIAWFPDSEEAKRHRQEIYDDEDAWHDFTDKASYDSDSQAAKQYKEELERTRRYQDYMRQLERVKRAEQTAAEAEASLPGRHR